MRRPANGTTLHWLSWQPTPYNDHLFLNLSLEGGVNLVVHYRSRTVASHPWKAALAAGYDARFYSKVLGVDWHLIRLAFSDRSAFFVVAGWDHPTSVLLLILLRLLKRRYALWTDTPSPSRAAQTLRSRLRSAFLRWIFAKAARLMATGSPGVDRLKEMGAPADRVVSFPFFPDLDAYPRRARRHSEQFALRLISSGRIDNRIKGHDLALRALSRAMCVAGGMKIEYIIAGSGPDEQSTKELARELGMQDVVRFLGWTEPEDLKAHYLSADIMIHPSPRHDPYPNAVLEGMAAELVVLASDASGSAVDRIQQGVNGLIHKAGDVQELAQQLIFLLSNLDRIPEMAARARATAEEWPVRRGVAIIKEFVQA